MKLSDEEIRAFTTGAIRFDADGAPVRTSEAQYENFGALRARCCLHTSGVRIKLITDGTELKFTLKRPGHYAVLQNGLQIFSREYLPELAYPITVSVGLEKVKKSTVEFVFPYRQPGYITDIEFEDATYIEKYNYKRKFLFYGDSITQGMLAASPVMTYASRISEFFDAEVLNQAVSGSWFMPDTVEEVPFEPDVVIISAGTNETEKSKSIEDVDTRCIEYFSKIKRFYGDKTVIVITPLWRSRRMPDAAEYFGRIREVIKTRALENEFTVIDGFTLVPHDSSFLADGDLHPNDSGFSFMTENLIKQIGNYIK